MNIERFVRNFKGSSITGIIDQNLLKYREISKSLGDEARGISTSSSSSIIETSEYIKLKDFCNKEIDIRNFNDRFLKSSIVPSLAFETTINGNNSNFNNSQNAFWEDLSSETKDDWSDIIPGWWQRFKALFSREAAKNQVMYSTMAYTHRVESGNFKGPIKLKKRLTAEDFFNQVKIKIDSSEKFKSKLNQLIESIGQADSIGQQALVDNLKEKALVDVYECALSTTSFNKYITFDDLVEFGSKSVRGVEICYLKNFVRIIPKDVVEKKKEADKLCIFDNYVVLHYDPKRKNEELTTKEKEVKAKDPILCGVIFGSEKLYYIADWIDEFCDLTWDKVMEVLKEKEENRTL